MLKWVIYEFIKFTIHSKIYDTKVGMSYCYSSRAEPNPINDIYYGFTMISYYEATFNSCDPQEDLIYGAQFF